MKTLTTRKMVFGLLMSLVLAFGVQGISEAVTTNLGTDSTSTVDITAKQVNDGITAISITPTLEDTADDPGVGDHTDTANPPSDRANTIETISVSASNIQLTGPTYTTSVTFSESTTTENDTPTRQPLVSGTAISLQGFFIREGKATLTITYTDLSDRQANDGNQATPAQTSAKTIRHTYTYYVVKSDSNIPATTTLTLTRDGTSLSRGYITGLNGRTDFRIYNNNSGNYPVTYSVVPSSATLYFSDTPYAASVPAAGSTVSSSSGRKVWLDMNGATTFGAGSTSVVTVNIGATTGFPKSSHNVAYIIGAPKLDISLGPSTGVSGVTDVAEVDNDDKNRYRFTGGTQGQNAGTITATVGDGGAVLNTNGDGFSAGAVPAGVLVKFELRHKGSTTGSLSVNTTNFVQVDSKNNSQAGTSLLDTDQTLYVRTNASGAATVNYWFGTLGSQEITVSSVGVSKKVTAEIGTSQTGTQISEDTNNQQPGNPQKFDLVALIEDADGEAISNEVVTFRTNNGELEPISARPSSLATPGTNITLQGIVNVITNSSGKAHVVYDIGDNTGRQEIHASLSDGKSYTFVINGAASSSGGGGGSPAQQEARLRITPSGTGTTREVTVDALTAAGTLVPGRLVTLSGTAVTGSPTLTTGTAETITVPSTPGIYRLTATDLGGVYASVTVVITVAASAAPGTLSLQAIGAPAGNLQQTVEVTATNAAGTSIGGVSVTLRGTGFATQTVTTGSTGSIRALVTIPSATGTHTLIAEATGYDSGSIDLSATGQPQQQTGGSSQPGTRGPVGVADSIEIDGDRQLSGTVNQSQSLRVQVTDANDNGVSGVKVTFRVLAPGQGRLSQRGNGRASQDETDSSGYARATVTPLGTGDLIIQAKAAGITAPVTFIIDVNGASETGTGTGSREPTETPGREISPEVLLGAAQRPPMVWVDSGEIYALVRASVGRFTPSVDNVMNIAVSGNKIYWTEKTGENAGTINAANLDGTDIKQLVSIRAVPRGIAVDPVAKRLYWTNSHGWIQSSNLQGTRRQNVARDLSDPMGIAVGNGSVYWAQGDGRVQTVNLTGTKAVRNISTGTDAANGVAVFGGKVYWTEKTGENAGTINAANLDGTDIKQLVSIRAVPIGIAVDPVAERLYWTNSHGWIQSSDLQGRARRNVANGLESPGGIVVNANIKETSAATPTQTESTPTASKSKYDVDESGTVDRMDTLLVAAAFGTSNSRFDVNGDGTVDIKDYNLVFDNLTPAAAGAPPIVGVKLSAVQIERIQEQIDLFIASNERSPSAMQALIYLQQLIATARPDQTQLLANYPNPFNPETWMPYELATDTDVRITIYNAQGGVIRTLQLGQQSAGYYTDRERAAYWDGRNAFGERVASGIYFYQLETDTMSALRKMVILK